MAIGGAARRGGQLASKLPTSSPKSKSKLKRRRGQLLQDVLNPSLRLTLLFLLALLVIGVFKVGLPSSSRSTSSSSQSWTGPQIGHNLSESVVDITTNALYDEIEFKDVAGGAWTQGWNVIYRGDEWNKEKLKVFITPHSHNDPGWLRTVEEYYNERSRSILSTIVQSLSKDKRRKFIWEEMSYLERWWRDASEWEKRTLINLVKSGQLEIVGGGWVMNDEANSHYFAIIEQITEGNIWLQDTVGVMPKNAWAIDPFGHSPTMAYLLRRMGFQNMLIQRTHYEVKKALALKQNLEFMWRQSWDAANNTDLFCHMMPFYSYDIPHTCGPEPAICCQFDFWRLPGRGYVRCPWGQHPQEISSDNVEERSLKLLDQYRKKSTLYKTNTLLVPLGDDFRYITRAEADLQYENYQRIFDFINSHPALKAEVQFGTLEDYFQAVRAEVGGSGSEQQQLDVPGFPSLSGDFFTYADRVHDYWSGYYVSRPFYKAVDRVLEETLRAADILFSLSSAYCGASHSNSFPLSFSDKLTAARRNLALFQHHDGVTGTAKDHVVVDYAMRMRNSLLDLQQFMAESMGVLLDPSLKKGICANASRDIYEPEQERSSYDVLPFRKAVNVAAAQMRRVAFYNPLEEAVDQVVMVVVDTTRTCVWDSNWASIESQVSPEWVHGGENITTGRHRLHWQASVPPMGIQTYFISSSDGLSDQSCKSAEPALLKVFSAPESFSCPAPYRCSQPKDKKVTEIRNQHQTMMFSVTNGLLIGVRDHGDGEETVLEEEIGVYSSRGSGAYLFKPLREAESMVQVGGLMLVTEGALMQEVYIKPNTIWDTAPVTRTARLFGGKNSVQTLISEFEYHVELLDEMYNDKEVIARFKTDVNSSKVFYSDLNGFQMARRETYDKIPLQGNYYPMPSLAFIQEAGGRRFSVHSRQAVGVASLESGWLEVMLDRRLSRDDDRGLGQGVLDNRPVRVKLHLLLEKNVTQLHRGAAQTTPSSSSTRVPSLLSHRVGAQLNYPLHIFLARRKEQAAMAAKERSSSALSASPKIDTSFLPLRMEFPCDLHVVSLKVPRPTKLWRSGKEDEEQQGRYAMLVQRRGWDGAYCKKAKTKCKTVDDADQRLLFDNKNSNNMFHHLQIVRVSPSSLNLLHDQAYDPSNYHKQSSVVSLRQSRKYFGGSTRSQTTTVPFHIISPMEIQAFKLELVKSPNLAIAIARL